MLKKYIAIALAWMVTAVPVLSGCASVPNQNNEAPTAANENSVMSDTLLQKQGLKQHLKQCPKQDPKLYLKQDLKQHLHLKPHQRLHLKLDLNPGPLSKPAAENRGSILS